MLGFDPVDRSQGIAAGNPDQGGHMQTPIAAGEFRKVENLCGKIHLIVGQDNAQPVDPHMHRTQLQGAFRVVEKIGQRFGQMFRQHGIAQGAQLAVQFHQMPAVQCLLCLGSVRAALLPRILGFQIGADGVVLQSQGLDVGIEGAQQAFQGAGA